MEARWDVSAYEAFTDLRLRPALDLLARVFSVPAGPVIDLGCGAGAAAPALRRRFPASPIWGVDGSAEMLAKAYAIGLYDHIETADIGNWRAAEPAALIFSNAALHWLGDHQALIPRLFAMIAPGGTLAVQMPGQLDRPSHRLMIAAAVRIRPDLFADWTPFPGPRALPEYAAILSSAASLDMWEAEYFQHLPASPDGAHPVRRFVSSTGARPILAALSPAETAAFTADWDAGLGDAYPLAPDGTCWFPFRRLFLVASRPPLA